MHRKILVLAALGMFTLACAGGGGGGGGGKKGGGKKGKAGGGDPDEVVCCQYENVKGTATRKSCQEHDPPGKVLPKDDC